MTELVNRGFTEGLMYGMAIFARLTRITTSASKMPCCLSAMR